MRATDPAARLAWAITAATADGDDDGREALMDTVADMDDARMVITCLAAIAAGSMIHGAPSRAAAAAALRGWVFDLAVAAEGGEAR